MNSQGVMVNICFLFSQDNNGEAVLCAYAHQARIVRAESPTFCLTLSVKGKLFPDPAPGTITRKLECSKSDSDREKTPQSQFLRGHFLGCEQDPFFQGV